MKKIILIICILFPNLGVICQDLYNRTPLKILESEKRNKINERIINYNIIYQQQFYINSNLPNLENRNGFYYPKGIGNIISVLLWYKSKHVIFTVEPTIRDKSRYNISIPRKEKSFSVLNDVPLNDIYRPDNFRNLGIKLHYSGFSAGFGNWGQWWGPGIHNSLILSNNSQGFYHYFIGTQGFQSLIYDVDYKFQYKVSDAMKNVKGVDYYLSAWFLNLKYKILELGFTRHVLSGGYNDLPWSQKDAFKVLIDKKNIKYWDSINAYYIVADFSNSGLKIFLEIGFPNRSYTDEHPELYEDHAIGSNLGFRKYGAFGNNDLMFGFEYTRIVQSIYYDILPTPNWYDNIKYNYSSYNGRRWAAHSGSDSDDFLVYAGYIDYQKSFIFGLNYERHGVTYHFPPEVKLESRISASYKINTTLISLKYEYEYFEHYGFVDVNRNVWSETFEPGSIQRTQTLLLSIEQTLFY